MPALTLVPAEQLVVRAHQVDAAQHDALSRHATRAEHLRADAHDARRHARAARQAHHLHHPPALHHCKLVAQLDLQNYQGMP